MGSVWQYDGLRRIEMKGGAGVWHAGGFKRKSSWKAWIAMRRFAVYEGACKPAGEGSTKDLP